MLTPVKPTRLTKEQITPKKNSNLSSPAQVSSEKRSNPWSLIDKQRLLLNSFLLLLTLFLLFSGFFSSIIQNETLNKIIFTLACLVLGLCGLNLAALAYKLTNHPIPKDIPSIKPLDLKKTPNRYT
jgi:hypothetical protein